MSEIRRTATPTDDSQHRTDVPTKISTVVDGKTNRIMPNNPSAKAAEERDIAISHTFWNSVIRLSMILAALMSNARALLVRDQPNDNE
mmetsp:Transcript_3862/g.6115  ORF Transcript_3862/g.6115 Transcript_3862/m.6115 type:complete len:88 (+) Transcript_3862:209-472(+)|eukprot:jgi/Bigna1/64285/fgenesh1_kg.71_\